MKKFFLVFALFTVALVQISYAQDPTKNQPSPLLTSYYHLKDALVNGNTEIAAANASEFIKTLYDVDNKTLKEQSRKSLLNDAVIISQTKDITQQRQKFASLSDKMVELAKKVKLTDDPVYQQYCPMKKASWLSPDKAIKNPYYGNMMLTCGSVKTTL